MSGLFGELKRRNVFRVALLYVVGSWLVLQVGEILFEALELPDWSLKFILAALLLGFPLALVFSWVYELTPEGIKLEKDIDRTRSITHHTSRKLDIAVIAVVLIGLTVVLGDRFLTEDALQPDAAKNEAPALSEPSTGEDEVSPPATPAPSISAPAQSVAVLPFTTRSTDPEDEFFADGMHDDLLTQLAKIGALKVISRTSVMEYKDTTKKVPEIAGELNVATVVEGAVQRAGARVRINAQLIDAATDQHLWAETFDRELTVDNLFDIQSEIATAIAGALEATLTPEEQSQIGRRLTDNLEAWEAYRRALRLLNGITTDEYRRAELEARRALELDPEFAEAYGLVARVHMANYWFYGSDPADREKAWDAIEAGRRIDPDSPQLDIAEAYFHYWGHLAYDKALAALERAIDAIPNDAELYKVKGYTLRRAGRYAEAIDALEKAQSLDPRNPLAAQTLMETFIALGRFDKARSWGETAAEINPNSAWLSVWRGELALAERADFEAAIHAAVAAGRTAGAASNYRTWYTYIAAGLYEEALQRSDLDGYIESSSAIYPPKLIAGLTHHLSGNQAAAEESLSKAREELETQLAEDADDHKLLKALCQAVGGLGDRAAALDYCDRALATALGDRFEINTTRLEAAQGLAMAGAVDQALEVLEATLDNPARSRSVYLRANPMLENLKADPRFDPLMEQIDRVEPLE